MCRENKNNYIFLLIAITIAIIGWIFYLSESDKAGNYQNEKEKLEKENRDLEGQNNILKAKFNLRQDKIDSLNNVIIDIRIDNEILKQRRYEVRNEIKSISSTNGIKERFITNGFTPVLSIRRR